MTKNPTKPSKQKSKRKERLTSPQGRCVLSGFDSFGKHKSNPSEVIVEASPDILKTSPVTPTSSAKEIHISKVVLPTEGDKAWAKLKKELDRLSGSLESKNGKSAKKVKEPTILVLTGYSQRAERLQLERIALNLKDYRIPDNSGKQVFDEPVVKKAPLALRSQIDLRALAKGLNADGYPAEVSNHAGTFICNELYFEALNYIAATEALSKKFVACLFVHIPDEKTFVESAASLKKSPLKKEVKAAQKHKGLRSEFLRDGVLKIVEHIAHAVV